VGKLQGVKCIECGGTRVWSTGLTVTRKGKRERGKCQDCARTFYVDVAVKAQPAKRSHKKKKA